MIRQIDRGYRVGLFIVIRKVFSIRMRSPGEPLTEKRLSRLKASCHSMKKPRVIDAANITVPSAVWYIIKGFLLKEVYRGDR